MKIILISIITIISLIGCTGKEPVLNRSDQSLDGNEVSPQNQPRQIVREDANHIMAIDESDFYIMNSEQPLEITLFSVIDLVTHRLGNSESAIVYEDKEQPYYSVLCSSWDSLYIEWVKGNGAILRIVVDNKGYKTRRGIKVGDSIDTINSLYGSATGYRTDNEIEFDLGNAKAETMMALIFRLSNGVVTTIEVMEGN